MPRTHPAAVLALAALIGGGALVLRAIDHPAAITPEGQPSTSARQAPSAQAPEPLASASGDAQAARARQPPDGFEEVPAFEEVEERPPPPEPPLPTLPPGPETLALARRYADLERRIGGLGVSEVHGRDRKGEPLFDIVLGAAARASLAQLKKAALAVLESRTREVVAAGHAPASRRALTELYRAPFVAAGALTEEGSGESRLLLSVEARGWLGGKLIGADFAIHITGGSDGVLAIFDASSSKLSMAVAASNYASITEGFLCLDHAVRELPEGGYHVMTVHSSPWISSAWRGAHLRILAPGSDPQRPRVLLDEPNSARAWEAAAALTPVEGGFTAEFSSWNALGTDVVRPHFRRFLWGTGGYRRVAPYTSRDHDLLDEWLQLPWAEARTLVAEGSVERLAAAHARLSKRELRLELSGSYQRKIEPGRRVFRLTPARESSAIITFTIEGEGAAARLVDVTEVERPTGQPGAEL